MAHKSLNGKYHRDHCQLVESGLQTLRDIGQLPENVEFADCPHCRR
jgi:hypothetical protein